MTDRLISYASDHPWHLGLDLGLLCAVLRACWLLRRVWSEPTERELWERFHSGAWQ